MKNNFSICDFFNENIHIYRYKRRSKRYNSRVTILNANRYNSRVTILSANNLNNTNSNQS